MSPDELGSAIPAELLGVRILRLALRAFHGRVPCSVSDFRIASIRLESQLESAKKNQRALKKEAIN